MSKPFFYRITAADFLAAVVTVPEQDRASWVLSLALDMVSGDADNAKSEFAKSIIAEASEFSDKKRAAANKRWSKEDKQKATQEMQTNAVHSTAMPEAVTEAVTVTEKNQNPDREWLIKETHKILGRTLNSNEFTKLPVILSYERKKIKDALKIAKENKANSLSYIITVLQKMPEPKKPRRMLRRNT